MTNFEKIAFIAFLALAFGACSSNPPATDPELAPVADAASQSNRKSESEANTNSEAQNENSDTTSDTQTGTDEQAQGQGNAALASEEKNSQASDDGYDDDWNNIGSQQATPEQQAQTANEDPVAEPSLNENVPLNNAANPMFTNNAAVQANTQNPVTNIPEQVPPAVEEPMTQQVVNEPPVDPQPAPVVEPAPAPSTIADEKPTVEQTSRAALIKPDLTPIYSSLMWVGYDHIERDGVARVEIVTRGSPRFNIFQERNKSDQPELVVRFFQTELRNKVRRDINTSEFRSPVAFIRMRPDDIEKHVDVIITLRDAINPRMYAKNGDIMLTFSLPDHYFGNRTIGDAPVARAEVLPNANIMPDLDSDSDISEGTRIAKAFIANPAKDVFGDVPSTSGQPVAPAPLPLPVPQPATPDGLPPDFSTPPPATQDAPQGEPPVQNAPIAANNAGSSVENSTGNQMQDQGDDLFSSQQSTGEQGMNGAVNEQFVANNASDTGEFDGEPAPSGGSNNFAGEGNQFTSNQEELTDGGQEAVSEQQAVNSETTQSEVESEGQNSEGEDPLNEDKLENFDNGEGESDSQIDKFDVRQPQSLPVFAFNIPRSRVALAWGFSTASLLLKLVIGDQLAMASAWQSFGIASVAQDNLESDQQFAEEEEVASEGNGSNQAAANQSAGNQALNNQAGSNQAGANNFGGNNFSGNNASNNLQGAESNPTGLDEAGSNNLLGGNNTGGNNTGGNVAGANAGVAAFGNTAAPNAAVANATANPAVTAPANPAAPAVDPAIPGNTAPANTVPVSSEPVAAPVNQAPANDGGVAPGEPPISGEADLSGQEQVGAESEAAPMPSAGGRPIKLDFRGAPLTEVIRMLGEESGVNFVLPPEIGDRPVYVNLKGVPFNDALRALLEANALGMVEVGPNIVRIDTLAKLAADKASEELRKKSELKLRPTKVLVYRLSYAKVEDAQKMLSEMLGAAAREDQRISVQIDQRTNSIIVNAPPNDLAMVKALLERIDLETPQVKIASRIVEVQKKFQEIFGVSWAPTLNFDQGRGLGFGNLAFPNSLNSRFAVDAGGNAAAPGTMGMRIGSINNALTLDLALAMEESRSAVEVLQSGNLIVEDNAEAEIIAGSSDFFRLAGAQAGGVASEDIAEVTYNLTMKVKPHITADGAVQMKVTLQSDSPAQPASQGGAAIAAKNNRAVTTSLLRKSGETAVIGGIYNTQKQKGNRGVPGLMHIPIIGALFRSSNDVEEKRELLVMVTPTIINGGSKALAVDNEANFSSAGAEDVAQGANSNSTQAAGQQAGNNINFGGNNFSDNNSDNLGDNAGNQGNLEQQQATQQTNQQAGQQANAVEQEVDLGEE